MPVVVGHAPVEALVGEMISANGAFDGVEHRDGGINHVRSDSVPGVKCNAVGFHEGKS